MAKIEVGTPVKSDKRGTGIITKIITKSTGYVLVKYDNGTEYKEMAFNLNDAAGQPLKAKPEQKSRRQKDAEAIAAFNAQSNLEKIKQSIMWINGKVQGDRNSLGYQLISERLAGIYLVAKEKGETFIVDVINSVEKYMRASEKQAFVIARFADQNGIKYEDK